MDQPAPPGSPSAPHVWLADRADADADAGLLVAFRDHIGTDWPPADAFRAGAERFLGDSATEYVLAAAERDAPAAGVAQLQLDER
jgi:hypothetical protein